LLITAQRREEVAGMAWGEVAFNECLWTLPPERAKNDKGHLVPLSDPALAILEALPRMESKAGLVFTTNGKTSVSGFSRAKERIDEFMAQAKRKAAAERGESHIDEIELRPWIIHDLRRTATTGMAKLKFPPHVVDKILNHTSGTIRGVAAVYNRHEYLDERRAALDAWGRYVEGRITGSVRSNVIPLTVAQ
jgi:integrase